MNLLIINGALMILFILLLYTFYYVPKPLIKIIKEISLIPELNDMPKFKNFIDRIIGIHAIYLKNNKLNDNKFGILFVPHFLAGNISIISISMCSLNDLRSTKYKMAFFILLIIILTFIISSLFFIERLYLYNSDTRFLFKSVDIIMLLFLFTSLFEFFNDKSIQEDTYLLIYVIISLGSLFSLLYSSKFDNNNLSNCSIMLLLFPYYQLILSFVFKTYIYYFQANHYQVSSINDLAITVFEYPEFFKLHIIIFALINILIVFTIIKITIKSKHSKLQENKSYAMYN